MYWTQMIDFLGKVQESLSKKIIKSDTFSKIETIAGTDVSFSKNNCAIAAAVIVDFESLEVLEKKTLKVELVFPYISGFLGFREADAVISVVKLLENKFDILMVNGHGVLHPRGFGLASHVGLLLDVPAIGVAKKIMVGNYTYDATMSEFINVDGHNTGALTKGMVVSIGHKISLLSALNVVKQTQIYKMPEPIRQAHILATNTATKSV